MAKRFLDLTEKEILALAISLEEEHARMYSDYADALGKDFPASAEIFRGMQAEESEHRRLLLDEYKKKFGEHIPLVRREDVRGFIKPKPVWLMKNLRLEVIRRQAEVMELETRRFYEKAAQLSPNPDVRKLLGDLAEAEGRHAERAESLEHEHVSAEVRHEEKAAERRLFVMQVVQPGLAGLMDGSVSTLAPLFAAAFATRNSWSAFVVGLAAAVGAGISMGFAEALSDDGMLTGRGRPLVRGTVCGLMTAAGGLGHTLPYLLPFIFHGFGFMWATGVAGAVVAVELVMISWIRAKYMDTPFLRAAFQIVVGGVLVFLAGILIGGS